MNKSMNWSSVFLTLLALAVVYGLGMTFIAVELEHLIETTLTPHILASPQVSAMNHEIFSGLDQFMHAKHVRLIGYTSVALIMLVALVGLLTGRRRLASLGSLGFILPVYAYFVLHMSFLAGLGVITALWAPFWGDLVKLGDIAYLPYISLVYPFSLAGLDVRRLLASIFASLGLLIFILGVFAWFYARIQKKNTADFWIYRFTRHPQYLGWILWSYSLILSVAFRHDTVLHQANPGASLPWVISTLIIVCVALSEEIHMRRQAGQVYAHYSAQTPFMLPLPHIMTRVISAPFRLLLKKDRPETRWDVLWTFVIYLALTMLLSMPFILLNWPPTGWANWPF